MQPREALRVLRCFCKAEDGIRDWSVTGVQTCALLFSSRRRHTRLVSDWSSDVCSSDLMIRPPPISYAVFCLRKKTPNAVERSRTYLVCTSYIQEITTVEHDTWSTYDACSV